MECGLSCRLPLPVHTVRYACCLNAFGRECHTIEDGAVAQRLILCFEGRACRWFKGMLVFPGIDCYASYERALRAEGCAALDSKTGNMMGNRTINEFWGPAAAQRRFDGGDVSGRTRVRVLGLGIRCMLRLEPRPMEAKSIA